MLLWVLVLFVTSVFSRVPVAHQEDVVSNHLVTDTRRVQTDAPISKHEETNTLDNSIAPNKIVPAHSTNVTRSECLDLLTLFRNADPSICGGNTKDNGRALILTPYIKEGKLNEARIACKVDPKHFLGFKSYSGFLTVNETYNSNIFFWYFPVLNKSVNDSPWLIWMQGGPGASSLIGLFDELGPFTYSNGGLRPNPYTWLRNHSLLFIENPVGTGYSFTDHVDGYTADMATYSSHLFTALKQFLQIFPELKSAPLYLAGESYAGKYVPAMAMEIHKRKDKLGSDINLKGLILGNAYIDPDMISHLPWTFYYFGLLEKEQIESVKPLVDAFQQDIAANRSVQAKNKWNNLITILLFLTHQKHGYNFLRDEMQVGRYAGFLQQSEVKRALHVGDIHYSAVNFTVNTKLAPDFLSTTKPLMEKLLEHYRVLAYCGQLDQMLPCVFTSANYRTWRWNGTEEFLQATRYPYIYNNRLWGYHKSGGNLTEVVVRGAGHMVPMDAPAPAQNMVAQWTHERPISTRYGVYNGSYVQEYVRNNTIVQYL